MSGYKEEINFGVSKIMNNYIISLINELNDNYNKLKLNNDINNFIRDSKTLFNFYLSISFINGRNLTRRKLFLDLLPNDYMDLDFIDYKNEQINYIISFIKDNINNHDLIIDQSIKLLIYIYRYGQLLEFKNNNIYDIMVLTNNNSCEYCKLLSKQKQNINSLIKELDIEHCDCYIKYVISNEINLFVLNKIKFSNENLLTKYNFILIDNIYDIENLYQYYSQDEINIINDNFISLQINNDVYINKYYGDINYLLIKYSIKDKLKVNKWWDEKFKNTNNFINYISMKNSYQYLVENVICYILEPNKLLILDKENYDKIKEEIFNNIEIW